MIPTSQGAMTSSMVGSWKKAKKEEMRKASELEPATCPPVSERPFATEICNLPPAEESP